MSREDLERWEQRYEKYADRDWRTDPWIVAQARGLPAGCALDVACGVGQHARWLAARGHRVIAIDGSYTALRRGRSDASTGGVLFVQADLERGALPAATFDLVVVARFLLRPLAPPLARTLRPGGHLLYATFTERRLAERPDFNRAYLLATDELPHLFPSLEVVEYTEVDAWARLHARRPQDP